MRFKNSVRFVALFAFSIMMIFSAGCDYGSKVWHDAQDTVNPNPTIDLHSAGIENPDDNKLALLFTPVDEKILSLTSFLSNIDSHPDEDWFKLLFMRFPWITGVFTVDEEANMLVKLPAESIKPFKPGPLVEYEGDWSEIKMKSFISYSEFGPEMYLCIPFFKDADFKGLVVVHFDPRILLNFCPAPQKLIIMQPDGGGIWTGDENLDKEAFLKIDWDALLDKDVHGITKVGEVRYVWLSRYVSDTQIMYVTKAVSESDEDDGFLIF
ncbi:hypothetical protein [Maridesulfovibrio ferrireducens]|uniref:hypothetical protein n=1 Tax=Maridesulfovibrio ferrireducens TaxID=246191 RepID=UPI001A202C24|nr:hypothetical protein [Maridesulfovibrio ferrireducens]MBI9110158.1 hypothetical protein [Maridesulfovibrio ferrireducens]